MTGELERRIDQALGRVPADLVIRNARILNVVTGELTPGDIAVCGTTIVGTLDEYRGREEFDAQGRIAVPGFYDDVAPLAVRIGDKPVNGLPRA